MSQFIKSTPSSGPGSGTVTSISEGTGITLTPNPITSTGTVALTIPVTISDGGTNATSMTNTDGVVYFDGTLLNTTAVGSSGQILTSNGAGMAPSFKTASPGTWVLIQSQSASSSASLSFISGITVTYTTYAIVITNIVPSTQATIQLVVSTNGGSTYANSGYQGINGGVSVTTGLYGTLDNTETTFWDIADNIATSSLGVSGIYYLYGLTNGNIPVINGTSFSDRAGTYYNINFGGSCTTTTINALRFLPSAGNIASGTITLFGILE